MKKLKGIFKSSKAVQYSINLEYHIEPVVQSENWNLYVALFALAAGLIILWDAMLQFRPW